MGGEALKGVELDEEVKRSLLFYHNAKKDDFGDLSKISFSTEVLA